MTAALRHSATAIASILMLLPAQPAIAGVQGPPDGLIPPPATTPEPAPPLVVEPTPSPAPAPAPTPAPAPARDRAEPRAAEPRTGEGAAPVPAAETPAASDIAPTGPAADTAPDLPLPAVPPPAPNSTPEWLPLAALGGGAALIGGGWLAWRRRNRRKPIAMPAPEAIAPPTPPSPPPAKPKRKRAPAKPAARPETPAPAEATNRLGRRADLSLEFELLAAQSTLVNLRLRYAVTVRNTGVIDAVDTNLRIGLFAGANINPQGVSQWYTLDEDRSLHGFIAIAAGGEHRFEGELAAPLDALSPVTIDGKTFAIPLVALDIRYGHGPGEAPIEGQIGKAFVVGRDSGVAGAKLAPFRLDQGPASFAPLGARDTGITKVV